MRSTLMARPTVWLVGLACVLVACSGDAGHSATGPSSSPGVGTGLSVTVTGTLVNNCLAPMPNMTVWIRGKGTTLTDDAGAFTFKDVVPPYDIGYVSAPGTVQSLNIVRIFQGVTRTTVRLPFPEYPGYERTGDLMGTMSGSTVAFPSPGSRITQIFFTAPGDLGAATHQLTDSPFTVQAVWCGSMSETGTLYAMQWTPDTLGSIVYNGYGKLDSVTATGDGLLTGQNIGMVGLTAAPLTGTATVPSGYTVNAKAFHLAVSLTSLVPNLQVDTTADPSFNFLAPVVPGTSLTVEVRASSAGRITVARQRELAPGMTGVSLALLPAPSLSVPAGNATDIAVATQTFQWSPFGGGLHILSVQLQVPALSAQLRYEVFTTGSSATVVSPTDLSIAFVPPGTSGTWSVAGLTAGSVDAFVDPGDVMRYGGTPEPAFTLGLPHLVSVGLSPAEAVSEIRFFQTH